MIYYLELFDGTVLYTVGIVYSQLIQLTCVYTVRDILHGGYVSHILRVKVNLKYTLHAVWDKP